MPKTIRAAIIILWIQIAVRVLFITAAIITISHKAEEGFWRGVQDSLAAASGASSLSEYGPDHAGHLSGAASVPLPFLLASLWGIRSRRLWPVVVCTVLLILVSFGQASVLWPSILILILVCTGSARGWLNHEVVPPTLT